MAIKKGVSNFTQKIINQYDVVDDADDKTKKSITLRMPERNLEFLEAVALDLGTTRARLCVTILEDASFELGNALGLVDGNGLLIGSDLYKQACKQNPGYEKEMGKKANSF